MSDRRKYSSKETVQRIRLWCDRQERAQQEVRDKLYTWGLHQNEVEEIIAGLVIDNFINEERFARAYASGKFRIKRWGRNKIRQGLLYRKISDYCLAAAMEEIDEEEYNETLRSLAERKFDQMKSSDRHQKFPKIATYLMNKGFEKELVVAIVNELLDQQAG